MGARPSGTVTFLFTDIEGSTRLWDEHPDTMREALARHDSLLRDAVDGHDGMVFSTGGDGLGAAFQRATDAVSAAVAAQRAFQAEPWPTETVLRVRMGMHTGEAQERDGDYFGPPVNRAARVMGAANGGQILVSAITAGLLGRDLEVEVSDLGEHRLKGLVEPIRLFGVHAPGLARVDAAINALPEVLGNLARPATEWFGSADGLRRRAAELPSRRIATLTGTGGVGKTRTAIEVGWLVADEFPGGVWFFDLAANADPDAVVTSIASTLGVAPQPGLAIVDAVVEWLRGRRLLMILDNCEHVIAPVSGLARAIVAGTDTVTILATSREPLGVPGERVVPIPSLDAPTSIGLFTDRAAAADETVRFSDADRVAIAAICERLDGIPLAIELAAARVRSAAPADLLARLDDRFRLLRGSGRGGLERHQTLRATVAWSHQLLTPAERQLFDRLSVFAGSFDAAAAEAVTTGGDVDDLDVVDLLDSLVDKSMVVAERTERGTRYRLLETLRQYGEERLLDAGETAAWRDRHLAHFLRNAEREHAAWLTSAQVEADRRFAGDWDNYRAAHQWALTANEVAQATALLHLVDVHAQTFMRHEYGEWVARTLAAWPPDTPVDPVLMGRGARWMMYAADFERAFELARAGVAAAPSPDHPDAVMPLSVLLSAGRASGVDGAELVADLRRATDASTDPFMHAWGYGALAEASREDPVMLAEIDQRMAHTAREWGSPYLRLSWLCVHSFAAFDPASKDEALNLASASEGAALALEVGDSQWRGIFLNMLAIGSTNLSSPNAPRLARDSLQHSYESRNWWIAMLTLDPVALALASTGDPETAGVVLGHLEAHKPPYAGPEGLELRHAALGAVQHEADHLEWMARGASMSRDELLGLVLARLPERD